MPLPAFVAVTANGAQRSMTSNDGLTWTLHSTADDSRSWNRVAFGNGLYVAVANDNANPTHAVMTSPDGATWTLQTTPSARFCNGICYGAGLYLAAHDDGSSLGNIVMTSPDAVTWTQRTGSLPDSGYCCAYGNGLFVVGTLGNSGGAQQIMTSPDGITWTSRSSPADGSGITSAVQTITFANGIFVAVYGLSGSARHLMSSPDGITWTTAATPPLTGAYYDVQYSSQLGQWVTGGDRPFHQAARSTDGTNWSQSTTDAATETFQCLAFGAGIWVALGGVIGSGPHLFTSSDGVTFTTDFTDPGGSTQLWESVVGSGAPSYFFQCCQHWAFLPWQGSGTDLTEFVAAADATLNLSNVAWATDAAGFNHVIIQQTGDGVDSTDVTGSTASMGSNGPMTIVMKVKLPNLTHNAGVHNTAILLRKDLPSHTAGTFLSVNYDVSGITISNMRLEFTVFGTGAQLDVYFITNAFADGNWHTVIVTTDGTLTIAGASAFVDGVSLSVDGVLSVNGTLPAPADTGQPLYLLYNNVLGRVMDLATAQIYDCVLPPATITALSSDPFKPWETTTPCSGGSPSISCNAPPIAENGVFYTHTFPASGGTVPYTFSITGGSLPDGLSLNASTGVVSGTPAIPRGRPQPFNFNITVTDSLSATGSASCSIAWVLAVALDCNAPPNGNVGTPYSHGLLASAGVPPYTFAITAGSLPTGLSLNTSTGVISGTPTVQGTFPFTAQVTDSFGATASVNCSITINAAITPVVGVPGPGSGISPAISAVVSPGFKRSGNFCPPKNCWDDLLEREACLIKHVCLSGWCVIPDEYRNLLPWDEDACVPELGLPWQATGGIVTPASVTGDQLMISHHVPLGYQGILSGFFFSYSGTGFVQGSGDIVFRIKVQQRFLKDLSAVQFVIGSSAFPMNMTEGALLLSDQTVSAIVNVPNLSGLIQVGASTVYAGLFGFIWPMG